MPLCVKHLFGQIYAILIVKNQVEVLEELRLDPRGLLIFASRIRRVDSNKGTESVVAPCYGP